MKTIISNVFIPAFFLEDYITVFGNCKSLNSYDISSMKLPDISWFYNLQYIFSERFVDKISFLNQLNEEELA